MRWVGLWCLAFCLSGIAGRPVASGAPQLGDSQETDQPPPPEISTNWLEGLSVQCDEQGRATSVYLGDNADDQLIMRLAALPDLQCLHLSGSGKLTLDGIQSLSRLKKLERLELHRVGRPAEPQAAWSSDELLRQVAQIDSLRELVADNCGISDQGVRHLGLLKDLTLLSLRQNRITDLSLKTIGSFKKLKLLDVGCYVRHADYGKNELTTTGLDHLNDLPELEHLNLEGTGASTLKLQLPKLASLSLGSSFNGQPHVSDRDMFLLQRFSGLRRLAINSDQVTDTGIAALSRLVKLHSLELRCARVTDQGLRRLTGLPLVQVTLSEVDIGDVGLKQLSSIETLESLEIYGAGRTTIEGFQQLRSLSRLRRLSLSGLQAAGSRVGFAELKQLRELHFGAARLQFWTQADLDRLGELMPQTRISVGTGGGFYAPQGSDAGFGMTIPPLAEEQR